MGASLSAGRESVPRGVRREGRTSRGADARRRADDVSRVRAEGEGDADREEETLVEQPMTPRRTQRKDGPRRTQRPLRLIFVFFVIFVAYLSVLSVAQAPQAQPQAKANELEILPVQGSISVITGA